MLTGATDGPVGDESQPLQPLPSLIARVCFSRRQGLIVGESPADDQALGNNGPRALEVAPGAARWRPAEGWRAGGTHALRRQEAPHLILKRL